jgi:small subunit ribosomal protein S4
MARMRGPKFKKCRSLGLNVCGHPKAMNRSTSSRADVRRLSPYGVRLLEKQRLRGYYAVMEKQFRRYVKKAFKAPGNTGNVLVIMLESRLDNLVYRLGFANSIRQARQMVVHGHIRVNGEKVDRPSYAVEEGMKISLKEKSRSNEMFKENFTTISVGALPYLTKDVESFTGTYVRYPLREEIPIQIDDRLVVEYYSRYL